MNKEVEASDWRNVQGERNSRKGYSKHKLQHFFVPLFFYVLMRFILLLIDEIYEENKV
ncbi:hypothetical protein TanjilG_10542 [Lupinus angustifolius]|uniref:Uncharacterized protein n=1 Tax=Lupinus angustifolius TaxID=3871 RepID=A0A1J7GRR7_LUPAN|nr:hypothetical protein TanjilG_10542 [Lupinus angustifolius]